MTRRVFVTVRAAVDVKEIWSFSADRFGADQADRYLDSLDATIQRAASHPMSGVDRGDLHEGLWSVGAGRHVVFYRFDDRDLTVVRVLHGAMDPRRSL